MITLILIAFSPLEELLILHEFGLINLQLFMNLQNASPCRVKTTKPGLPLLLLPKQLLPIRQTCKKRRCFPLHTPFSPVQMTFSSWLSCIPNTVADSFHSGPGTLASSHHLRNETLPLLPAGRGICFFGGFFYFLKVTLMPRS